MAVYCISDIHGHNKEFEEMLRLISFDEEQDHLYVLGDMIDIGPDSIEVMKKVHSSPAMTALKGRHEEFLCEFIKTEGWMELNYYNYDTYQEMLMQLPDLERDMLWDWLEELPLRLDIQYNGRKYILSHGTALFGEKHEFDWDYFLPVRGFFEEYLEKPPADEAAVIVGHTPAIYVHSLSRKRKDSENKIWKNRTDPVTLLNIDCGAAFLKEDNYSDINRGTPFLEKSACLGCLRLDDMKEYYVNID